MGSTCSASDKSTTGHVTNVIRPVSGAHKTQVPDTLETVVNAHSAEEILDDSFKTEINEAIDECIVSIPTTYQTEHDRIVDQMSSSAPEPYLGLLFSEYPDVNASTVKEMARRLATSGEVKQQISDQVNERMKSSFVSRTADWDTTSRESARPAVKTFIEKLVSDAADSVKLE